MGAYTTVSLTGEQYGDIIALIRNGYTDGVGVVHRPNNRVATALVTEYNLTIRIIDILKLRLSDIIKDGDHYRLNIIEQKTGKPRTYLVPDQFYNYLSDYCALNHIGKDARIFPITERAAQKILKAAAEHLGYTDISTHSFRKFAAATIYEKSGNDIELVRDVLQHSSIRVTQGYLKRSSSKLEAILSDHISLL